MTIIGVRDGRFDESVFELCSLSFEAAIGFGIDWFVVDWEKKHTKNNLISNNKNDLLEIYLVLHLQWQFLMLDRDMKHVYQF